MGGNRPARTSVPDTLLVAAALFLGGSVLAGLLGRDDLRLMDRARLDPERPLPRTLNHAILGFAVTVSAAA